MVSDLEKLSCFELDDILKSFTLIFWHTSGPKIIVRCFHCSNCILLWGINILWSVLLSVFICPSVVFSFVVWKLYLWSKHIFIQLFQISSCYLFYHRSLHFIKENFVWDTWNICAIVKELGCSWGIIVPHLMIFSQVRLGTLSSAMLQPCHLVEFTSVLEVLTASVMLTMIKQCTRNWLRWGNCLD